MAAAERSPFGLRILTHEATPPDLIVTPDDDLLNEIMGEIERGVIEALLDRFRLTLARNP